jgi:thiamine biosynthesis lipoprotein
MIEPKIYFPEVTINKMNVPFTIKLAVTRDDDVLDRILATTSKLIAEDLDEIDDKFSPLKTDSLISKFHRGDSEVFFQDAMFQIVYNQCAIAKVATNGYYDAFKNDRFDPTGILKGWAIETEFQKHLKPLLVDPSIVGVSLSVGNDMQLASKAESSFEWNIGITNPDDQRDIIAEYNIKNGAIATTTLNNGDIKTSHKAGMPKQITILSKGLTEAAVLANAGMEDTTDEVEKWIEKSQLTGLLIDVTDDMTVFAQGQFDNVIQAQM